MSTPAQMCRLCLSVYDHVWTLSGSCVLHLHVYVSLSYFLLSSFFDDCLFAKLAGVQLELEF